MRAFTLVPNDSMWLDFQQEAKISAGLHLAIVFLFDGNSFELLFVSFCCFQRSFSLDSLWKRPITIGSTCGFNVLCTSFTLLFVANLGGKNMFLFDINKSGSPVEVSFQAKYGEICDYRWYGDGCVTTDGFRFGFVCLTFRRTRRHKGFMLSYGL